MSTEQSADRNGWKGRARSAGRCTEECPAQYHDHKETPFFGPHEILGLRQVDGMPYVKCACGKKPLTDVWLSEHWGGDQREGIDALRMAAAMQRARVHPDAP